MERTSPFSTPPRLKNKMWETGGSTHVRCHLGTTVERFISPGLFTGAGPECPREDLIGYKFDEYRMNHQNIFTRFLDMQKCKNLNLKYL